MGGLRLGGCRGERRRAAAFLPTGEPLIIGSYHGDTDLGTGPRRGSRHEDGYLLKRGSQVTTLRRP